MRRSWTPLHASYGPRCDIKVCHEVATAVWARRHRASPFAIESFGPRYKEPMAIAFSNRGCVHSRKTNVARCRIGKVGMKRTKNMCRHSSRKTDVMEVAFTAAVTLEDELVTISDTSRTA